MRGEGDARDRVSEAVLAALACGGCTDKVKEENKGIRPTVLERSTSQRSA